MSEQEPVDWRAQLQRIGRECSTAMGNAAAAFSAFGVAWRAAQDKANASTNAEKLERRRQAREASDLGVR